MVVGSINFRQKRESLLRALKANVEYLSTKQMWQKGNVTQFEIPILHEVAHTLQNIRHGRGSFTSDSTKVSLS